MVGVTRGQVKAMELAESQKGSWRKISISLIEGPTGVNV